ncbi:MAG: carboxypeptidase-like regulatory domain-containing protein [Bryobacteraceae bacterium]
MRNVILLVLCLAACLPSFADSDVTRVTVKVVDDRGKPIDRANVRLVFKQGRRKSTLKKIKRSWELKTSQEGTAKLPGIPKGDIMIQVTAKNHQSFGDTFTIEEDEKLVEITLKPPQEPYSVHGPNDPRAKQQ